MHTSIRKLQVLLLAQLGVEDVSIAPALAHYNIDSSDLKASISATCQEIRESIIQIEAAIPDSIPNSENSGIYGLMRHVYRVNPILSDQELVNLKECFSANYDATEMVYPSAVCTLVFNTDTLLTKTTDKLFSTPGWSIETTEHLCSHIARIVSYLHILDTYGTIWVNRNYDQHVLATEAAAENRSEFVEEVEQVEAEQLMLYEGLECLLAGREPTTQGELYTQGILTANSMYSVYGAEAWYDGVVNAIKKIIEKIKEGLKKVIDFFSGSSSPSEKSKELTGDAKENHAKLEKQLKPESVVKKEAIDKMVVALEAHEPTGAGPIEWKPKAIAVLKAFAGSSGAAIATDYQKLASVTKDVYDTWANDKSHAGLTAKIANVGTQLAKLTSLTETDKDEIAKTRKDLDAELVVLKEESKEMTATTISYGHVVSSLAKITASPFTYIEG